MTKEYSPLHASVSDAVASGEIEPDIVLPGMRRLSNVCAMAVKWLGEPETHDYDAAADYLSMVAESATISATVAALRHAETVYRKAKDILRAARLPLLPESNSHVRADLAKISDGKKLSPILLVRGQALADVALQIADGYHRVCASYLTDENTAIPCRLVSWET